MPPEFCSFLGVQSPQTLCHAVCNLDVYPKELELVDVTNIENTLLKTTPPTPNRYTQLSQSLLWLNERAWPLTIGVLLTAGVYLYQYIQEEKIPLSITSSAVITALPVMSAILVFIISVLAAFILLPIFVLFHRLDESGKRLSDEFSVDQTSPEKRARHRGMLWRWGSSLLIFGTFCALLTLIGSQITATWYWGLAAALGLMLTMACYFWLLTFNVERPVSTDFRFACVMSAFVQIGVILNVTIVAIEIADQYIQSLWWLVPLMAGVLFFVWMIQLLGAMFVVKMRRHEHPVALIASVGIVLVILLGLYPPTGAKLGGFAFQVSASGARNCSIMNFVPESKGLEPVMDPGKPGFSLPLRVIAEADGVYFVRPWRTDTKAVRFVPRASLLGVDGCPAATPG